MQSALLYAWAFGPTQLYARIKSTIISPSTHLLAQQSNTCQLSLHPTPTPAPYRLHLTPIYQLKIKTLSGPYIHRRRLPKRWSFISLVGSEKLFNISFFLLLLTDDFIQALGFTPGLFSLKGIDVYNLLCVLCCHSFVFLCPVFTCLCLD